MNRLTALAAFALALSTLSACDLAQALPHQASGELAAPAPKVCPVAQANDNDCPEPPGLPNDKR